MTAASVCLNTGTCTTAALPIPVGRAAVVVVPVCRRGRVGNIRRSEEGGSNEPIGGNERRERAAAR
jgi:hypothetical protein